MKWVISPGISFLDLVSWCPVEVCAVLALHCIPDQRYSEVGKHSDFHEDLFDMFLTTKRKLCSRLSFANSKACHFRVLGFIISFWVNYYTPHIQQSFPFSKLGIRVFENAPRNILKKKKHSQWKYLGFYMFSGTISVILSFSFKLISPKPELSNSISPNSSTLRWFCTALINYLELINSMELLSPFWLTVQASGNLLLLIF